MVLFEFVGLLIITLLVHFILFMIHQFDKKKEQEQIGLKNVALILQKLDDMENVGGLNKMNEDIKKLAKYLKAQIDLAKEEIIETLDSRFDELSELAEGEETEEVSDFAEEFGEIEEGETEEKDTKEADEKKKKMDEIFDIKKRQKTTEEEPKEDKKRKRGLFGRKK